MSSIWLNNNEIDKIPNDSGIYIIRNKTNNKIYVGSAIDLHKRIYNHCYLLRKNEHRNPHLQAAWNKYGEENFEFAVVEECEKDDLLFEEQFWLDRFDSYDNKYGYNICPIAGSTIGKKLSEETKEKIRTKAIGRKVSDEARKKMSEARCGNNNGMYGKHHSEESIQKIKDNKPNATGENNSFFGKHHSDETKELLRKKALERNLAPRAILTEQDVFEIKWEIFRKPKDIMWKIFDPLLASKYNISSKTISDIRTERRWRSVMVNTYVDKKNRFVEMFNPKNGFYVRSGVIDENGKDTGVDPFMRNFPSLLDIGVMKTCVCSHRCNVDCYQRAIDKTGANMSLENLEIILKQSKGKVFQCALGGAGDVDTHEHFEEMLKMFKRYNIVPNFTTSGIMMTKEKAEICKNYCGSIAVSEHFADYTDKALDLLLEAGVKTNIHYVLSNKTIDVAIDRLKNNGFKKGINAVVFLLYKPVGLGKEENVLKPDDPRVKEFFELIDKVDQPFSIGFDSCCSSGIVNFTSNVNMDSMDYCEGGRHSAYIDADMNMMPCSFANQDPSWFMNLKEYSIEEVWNSELFDKFRYSLKYSCKGCSNRENCSGGCPLVNQITLCNRDCRDFQKGRFI